MKLRKIKRPRGEHVFDVQPAGDDEHGTWLYAPAGSRWVAPNDVGSNPFALLLLLSPERDWVAWWVDEPADRRLYVDICHPPVREREGWAFVDLELDLVRRPNGTVEIEDQDEFEVACEAGWIEPDVARQASATTQRLEAAMRAREEPLGDVGWQRLNEILAGTPTTQPAADR